MLMNYELIIFVIVDNFDNLTLKRIEICLIILLRVSRVYYKYQTILMTTTFHFYPFGASFN